MKVLLINPPLSVPTGPYPAICYLTGYLEQLGVPVSMSDASLEVLLRLFSRSGLERLIADLGVAHASGATSDGRIQRFLANAAWYVRTVDTAVACLQGADVGAAERASRPGYFPPPLDLAEFLAATTFHRVSSYRTLLGELTPAQTERAAGPSSARQFSFGALPEMDEAKFLASQLLEDVASVIRSTFEPNFELDSYLEHLTDDGTFDSFQERLDGQPNLLDRLMDETADDLWARHRPAVVGFTVPFRGSLLGALRLAKRFKELNPAIATVAGGGWINTTLRRLADPRVFEYFDFVTLDDGERPLECVLDVVKGVAPGSRLLRTFTKRQGQVVYTNDPTLRDVPATATGVPTYRGLPLDRYLVLRPSLWQRYRLFARRWNKLTLAHGCYWKRCTFCDTALDYIGRYEPAAVDLTLSRISALRTETGESGFHFVDEAMPPAVLRRLSERLVAGDTDITWWGNVRFDEAFIPLAPLLAQSGCLAVTGGLEAASNRLLGLIDKGVSVEQVARVTWALASAGIFVHAYLIYGFPTQTAQETIDALEYVRQLIEHGCVHSVRWHRFALTEHSPVARNPEQFGIRIVPSAPNPFSNYVLNYDEPGGINHRRFRKGLLNAVEMYMRHEGFSRPLPSWFDFPVPETTVSPTYIRDVLRTDLGATSAPNGA